MSKRNPAGRHRMPARDRQMLVAGYLPVVAFATVLIAGRMPRTRRHQLQAAVR